MNDSCSVVFFLIYNGDLPFTGIIVYYYAQNWYIVLTILRPNLILTRTIQTLTATKRNLYLSLP